MSECMHPEHAEPRQPRHGKSRCCCYDCLIQRDGILGDAISRLVHVVEVGSLRQIQAMADNADAALWDHATYISSGAAETIRRANSDDDCSAPDVPPPEPDHG